MSFISGLLGLGGIAVSGVITEPPASTGYARTPISFDTIASGTALNTVNATFGPVIGSGTPWGNLTNFQVFDPLGNPAWIGLIQVPVAPVQGEMIFVPVGAISIGIVTTNPSYMVDPSGNILVDPSGNPLVNP